MWVMKMTLFKPLKRRSISLIRSGNIKGSSNCAWDFIEIHHCTQPLMDFYKIPGTIRASFAFYNTKEEIDTFISAVEKSINMLR